ncbi:MAG: type II toxin-antitoxin system RelE family toxin [Dethiobacteria bacterium]|jgi:mRNA interferase RelE/StbE
MKWYLEITPKAKKDLEKLDKSTQKRITDALSKMISDKERVDLRKLKNTDKWRLRVGTYRVILKVEENGKVTIYALRVLHRRDAYKSI